MSVAGNSGSEKGVENDEEKFGPRVGVKMDLEGANLILKRHLGKPCKTIREVKRGFNNRTYIVTMADGDYDDASSVVIRLPGIHWTKVKTEGEVAAIIYLRMKCPDISLPRIYGYCSDKKLSGIGHEYILMEHLQGVPLDEVFNELSFEEQKEVLAQIAKSVAAMKAIKFDKIGSFGFVPHISQTHGLDQEMFKSIQPEHVMIGKTVDQEVGPFNSYLEYFKAMCAAEIVQLKKCKFMEPQMKNLERIEKFIESIGDILPDSVANPDLVFMHGDFEPRNILVNGTTITGLHDLEFSGSFPIDNEWFDGFNDFGASTCEWVVFKEDPPEDHPNPVLIKRVREYFLSECKKNGAIIPEQIPGHIERAELYFFWCNICPWYLREVREDIPEKWFKEREYSMSRVETVLSKYGF